MTDLLYNYSLFAAWVMLFIFGGCLLVSKTPNKKIYRTYQRSKNILGIGLILFGIQILLQWIFDFRTNARHFATAMNITCYYLEGILFGMSFISLLDPTYITSQRIKKNMTKWFVCTIIIWGAALFLTGILRTCVQAIVALFFFVDASRIAIMFFKVYHAAIHKVENYYADNVDNFVLWLYKSTYGIVFFGLTGAILAFAPKWVIAIQMSAGIFMFIYIFQSFINYMINFDAVEVAVYDPTIKIKGKNTGTDSPQDNDIIRESTSLHTDLQDNDNQKQIEEKESATFIQIENELKNWVKNKNYRQNGITVEQVANQIYTNRTYLSMYINTKLKCSFRDWICDLRIKEAKQLFKQYPDQTVEQIAYSVGFASASHFARQFNEHEKITPAQWRKEQKLTPKRKTIL
jgi:AraC-like DNA-binding protein